MANLNNKTKVMNFPAFPFPGFAGAANLPAQPSNTGMSYRDFVAVHAMEQLMRGGEENPSVIARLSFGIADAMLNERDCRL